MVFSQWEGLVGDSRVCGGEVHQGTVKQRADFMTGLNCRSAGGSCENPMGEFCPELFSAGFLSTVPSAALPAHVVLDGEALWGSPAPLWGFTL